jgi:methionyl-tRNA formyltransferase
MKVIIANSNAIYSDLEERLKNRYNAVIINKKEELTVEFLQKTQPDYIFFPHWSYIVPSKIYTNFECIVFHMTDLPYGRGGSPLQNLIVRGHEKTKVSALQVRRGMDTGSIYLKKDLSLLGTAEEVFLRTSIVVENMIEEIITKKIEPIEQEGEATLFTRRKSEQSSLEKLTTLDQVFDYIRMLDAEGYPHAFLETEYFRLEFTRASLKKDSILADVRIIKK